VADRELVALTPVEVRRVVLPEKQLKTDLDQAVKPWLDKGFTRLDWKGKDANAHVVLPDPQRDIAAALRPVVRRFKAKKGNTYGIVTVTGDKGEFNVRVYAKGAKKPVFVRQANGTAKYTTSDGKEEFGDDFVADKAGQYEVRFSRAMTKEPGSSDIPLAIHIAACAVEIAGSRWKPEAPVE